MVRMNEWPRILIFPRFCLAWFGYVLASVLIWGCAARPATNGSGADRGTVSRLTAAGKMSNLSNDYMPSAKMEMASAKMAIAPASAEFRASRDGSAPPPKMNSAPSRMVYYTGEATLRSTDPDKALDSAIQITNKSGGYLESRTGFYVTLRVPAPQFDSLFLRIMRLGEVVSFSQSAQDITEAFQDADMRLQLVIATLERLEALVQKARTDSQKLQLLGQLKQLREEREVLESTKRALSRQASFATINLQMQEHTPAIDGQDLKNDIADFQWIHRLGPFDDKRFTDRRTQSFATPEGMVVSSNKRPWRATASQGAEFWGSSLCVKPIGDARFWSEAIRLRLKDGFKAADTLDVGGFRFCKFQSFGATPYFYWVGVDPQDHYLNIVELYFPTEAQQTQHLAAILAAVKKGPVPWYSLF